MMPLQARTKKHESTTDCSAGQSRRRQFLTIPSAIFKNVKILLSGEVMLYIRSVLVDESYLLNRIMPIIVTIKQRSIQPNFIIGL